MAITLKDNGSSYSWEDAQGGHCVMKGESYGADSERLAELLADPTTIVIPYVPPPPPTPAKSRDRLYRSRLDDHARLVVLCQVLLEKIPDTAPNAAIRTRLTDRLAAAKTAILDIAIEIENANPDVP